MDMGRLQKLCDDAAHLTWCRLARIHPGVLQKSTPAVVLNRRLKTTAGYAMIEESPQLIHLSVELLIEHTDEMLRQIVPHEIAHLAAFTVYGDRGHGQGWKTMMRQLGKTPNRTHDLVNTIHEARKAKVRL